MGSEWHKRIRIILVVLLAVALARTGLIFYSRRDVGTPGPKQPAYALSDDDYVTPHKIFPYDLKSAVKELAGKTVWVRVGNVLPYYRYNPASRSADLAHQAGLLPPLAQLRTSDVVLQRAPVSVAPGQVVIVRKEIMAVFTRSDEAGAFAVSIGSNVGDDFNFTANDVLFFQNPHDLYKHWPAEVWSAIDQHQGKKGMNELQMSFALGAVIGASSGDYGNRWVQYGSAKNLIKVTFEKNQATEISKEESN
jgi:hypothetical protein